MLKIGLLGAARIAPKGIIRPALKRRDTLLTHLACRDHDRGREYCTANNLENITLTNYRSLAEMADVDMIYCALPPAFHVDLVEAALSRGVHVLCEKPISMTAQEAQRMVAASKKSGAVLLEAFHYFFHPAFAQFQDSLTRGVIGKPLSARGHFTVAIANKPGQLRYIPELGGGALMDLGCYPLHMARQLFGEPKIMSAKAVMKCGVDEALTANMVCGDVKVHLHCNMGPKAKRENYFEVIGEKGTLRFIHFIAPHEGYTITATVKGFPIFKQDFSDVTTYDYQLSHFIDMICGAAPRLASDDGVAQMAAIESLYDKAAVR